MKYKTGQKEETKQKIKSIAEYVKENPEVKQKDLIVLFKCHRYTASEAMTLAGVDPGAGRKQSSNKLNEIVEYLKANGYQQQKTIMQMFDCGKDMASRAVKEAGFHGNKAKGLPGISKLGQNPEYIKKLERIVVEIKRNPDLINQSRREILKQLNCGNETVVRAMAVINDGLTIEEAIQKHARVAKAVKEAGDRSKDALNETMHRPSGINYLSVAW